MCDTTSRDPDLYAPLLRAEATLQSRRQRLCPLAWGSGCTPTS